MKIFSNILISSLTAFFVLSGLIFIELLIDAPPTSIIFLIINASLTIGTYKFVNSYIKKRFLNQQKELANSEATKEDEKFLIEKVSNKINDSSKLNKIGNILLYALIGIVILFTIYGLLVIFKIVPSI